MPVDTSIYGQFAEPARSTADYAAQYDAADARRMALQQNALALQKARQDMQQGQNVLAQRQALRDEVQSGRLNLLDPTHQARALSLAPDIAPALLKTVQEGQTSAAKAGLDTAQAGHATAQTADLKAKTVADSMKRLATGVLADPTLANAQRAVIQMAAQHGGDPTDELMQLRQLGDNPNAIKQWAAGHAMSADQLLPKTANVGLGGTMGFTSTNPVTGAVTMTGQQPITQSADSIASNATTQRGQNMTAGAADAARRQAERHFNTTQSGAKWDAVNQVWVNPQSQTVTPGTLPNGQPMPGKTPPIEYQKQATAFQNMDDALTNYKTVLAGFGKGDMLSPTKRAEMGQAYQNALLQAKEIYQLGVLNGGDERILKGIINSPLDFTSAMIPTEALKKQATDLQGILVRNNENMAKVHRQTPIPLKSTFGDKQPIPQKNLKGWELHTDANGNKAYVSPDGKQFEEVKSGV